MRVFNKEVRGCFECKYNAAEGQGGYTMCKYTYEDTDDLGSEKFHKDCPFNKSITKEVIEGFGFVKDITLIFQKPDLIIVETTEVSNSKYYKMVYSFRYKTCEIMDCEDSTLFLGNINNPIELEFILRSIGVIK